MKIETKAMIGDEIYFMEDNKAKSDIVRAIAITIQPVTNLLTFIESSFEQIEYTTETNFAIPEYLAFLTKQSLLDNL